jgi:hypothetical protein
MAFETNALVNGAWTTQTLDVNTVLRHYDQQDREANERVEIERTPVLGLLTQTVIRSALAHWILPARIRNSVLNDVAFIGVSRHSICPDCVGSHFQYDYGYEVILAGFHSDNYLFPRLVSTGDFISLEEVLVICWA